MVLADVSVLSVLTEKRTLTEISVMTERTVVTVGATWSRPGSPRGSYFCKDRKDRKDRSNTKFDRKDLASVESNTTFVESNTTFDMRTKAGRRMKIVG